MVSLFIGLYAAAGVEAEKSGAPRAQAKPRARIAAPATAKPKHWAQTLRERAPVDPGLPPALTGLMASLPKGGDGWTKETRDKFVALFGITLDFCIPVVTQADIDNMRAAEE